MRTAPSVRLFGRFTLANGLHRLWFVAHFVWLPFVWLGLVFWFRHSVSRQRRERRERRQPLFPWVVAALTPFAVIALAVALS